MLGEHRIPEGKNQPYEPSSHLPLFMSGPGIPAGNRWTWAVGTQDLAPTILDIADASADIALDGISVLPTPRRPNAHRTRGVLFERGQLPVDAENGGRIRYAAPRTVADTEWSTAGS